MSVCRDAHNDRRVICNKRGFTVLELLVVIAIISILSAVILVALNGSRSKGKDAGIKSQLSEARNQAQLYFESFGGKYCSNVGYSSTGCQWGELGGSPAHCTQSETVFSNDGSPNTIGKIIEAANGLAPQSDLTDAQPQCFMDDFGTKWAITIKLNDTEGRWCVDSSGNAKVLPTDFSTTQADVYAAGFKCP